MKETILTVFSAGIFFLFTGEPQTEVEFTQVEIKPALTTEQLIEKTELYKKVETFQVELDSFHKEVEIITNERIN